MPVTPDLPLVALMHPDALHGAAVASHARWSVEPGVVVPLVLSVGIYAVGLVRLWRVAGVGAGVTIWRAAAFGSGCLAIVAALVSPVDAISTELSSVHMVQHELLMMVAAPLLVAGLPMLVALYALPASARRPTMRALRGRALRASWSLLTTPATVWLLHAAALWVWHAPPLYEEALRSEPVHAAQHACFFGTALLFWWGITHGRYGRMGYGVAVVYLFATALHTGLLGAALTLSTEVWYPVYGTAGGAWGLTPIEDQQLAGLIMWVPAGGVFTAMGLIYFAAWLRESERRSRIIWGPR